MKNVLTQEQLFDYYLGLTDHNLTREIEDHIKTNPQVKNILKEFEEIENGFANFPITEPSDKVVQRVREQALKEIKPNIFESIKTFFLTPLPIRRSLAWVVMILIVVGLSFALGELRKTDIYSTPLSASNKAKNTTQPVEHTANFNGAIDKTPINPVNVAVEKETTFQTYARALEYYQQNKFQEANNLFNKIINTDPLFPKRVELYNIWILSLKQANDPIQAQARQDELLKIQKELAPKETM